MAEMGTVLLGPVWEWDECIQPNAEREAERGSHSAKKLATNAPG